jgi:predicted oxidoreductase (fatty acid repression mutant protein)
VKEVNLNNFKASNTFITNLKNKHGISSRKITKFVAVKDVQGEGCIKETASKFTDQANVAIMEKNLQDNEIWNCNQSQFNYEMSSNTTLNLQAKKDTFAIAHTSSSLMHSYPIHVTIFMAEKLGQKVYICFQKPEGK